MSGIKAGRARSKGRSAAEVRAARRMMGLLKRGRDLRKGMVSRIGRAIEAGTYENRLKLEVAVERMEMRSGTLLGR